MISHLLGTFVSAEVWLQLLLPKVATVSESAVKNVDDDDSPSAGPGSETTSFAPKPLASTINSSMNRFFGKSSSTTTGQRMTFLNCVNLTNFPGPAPSLVTSTRVIRLLSLLVVGAQSNIRQPLVLCRHGSEIIEVTLFSD